MQSKWNKRKSNYDFYDNFKTPKKFMKILCHVMDTFLHL